MLEERLTGEGKPARDNPLGGKARLLSAWWERHLLELQKRNFKNYLLCSSHLRLEHQIISLSERKKEGENGEKEQGEGEEEKVSFHYQLRKLRLSDLTSNRSPAGGRSTRQFVENQVSN